MSFTTTKLQVGILVLRLVTPHRFVKETTTVRHGPTLAAALSCTTTMILFYILSSRTVTISLDSTEQAASSFYRSQCSSVRRALPYSTVHFPRGDMVCCMYSDRLRFTYLKVAKSAGSTVALGWLRSSPVLQLVVTRPVDTEVLPVRVVVRVTCCIHRRVKATALTVQQYLCGNFAPTLHLLLFAVHGLE